MGPKEEFVKLARDIVALLAIDERFTFSLAYTLQAQYERGVSAGKLESERPALGGTP